MAVRISGKINGVGSIGGRVSQEKIGGKLKIPEIVTVPDYTGDYEVTPKMYEETTLPTTGKKCTDDITVHKIPQYEVSNTAGGITAIIGDEYNGD